jgi:hypothetical protein
VLPPAAAAGRLGDIIVAVNGQAPYVDDMLSPGVVASHCPRYQRYRRSSLSAR